MRQTIIKFILELRNKLLTGREKHPLDHRYQVRRCDIRPDLKIIVWVKTTLTNSAPVITKDSQMLDALAHPEKYTWFGQGKFSIGTIKGIYLTFTSKPYLRDGHWFAKAIESTTNKELEFSLFSLGIVPDYIFNPERDEFDPAGWNPNSQPQFTKQI